MRHFLDYTDKKTRELIEERFFSDSEDGSESEASASQSESDLDSDSDAESDAEPAASVASSLRHQAARKNGKAGQGGSGAASRKRAAERWEPAPPLHRLTGAGGEFM